MKIIPKQTSSTHAFEVLTEQGLYEMVLVFEDGKLAYEWVNEYDVVSARFKLCEIEASLKETMRNEILRSQITNLP